MSRSSQGHKTLREKIFPEACCSNRQKNKERVLELIENHPCFLEITLWKNIKVESLHIEDLPKKEMTKEYLRIVCNT